MHEEKSSSSGKTQSKFPLKDIGPILTGWDYESGTINVRKIIGLDGRPKLQMRLDLGLLQMEMNGRPDGVKPHGCESLLEFHERRLREHRRKNGTELGFHLTPDHCQGLREEALMYYHRYLSLFVLEEFNSVARDTARNLRVLDLCSKFAVDEHDRLILEQYRPYIIMMNARALATLECQSGDNAKGYKIVRDALKDIKAFFRHFGQEQAYRHSNEVKILKQFGREIRKKLPVDPAKQLQSELNKAVKEERYEEAARLRDELARMQPPHSQA